MRHSVTDERLLHEHSNVDIDKELTESNIAYGAAGSYAELCNAYDERIAELDATTNKNHRKDRQTCFCLCVTRPADLVNPEEIENWFKDVHELFIAECGEKNVLGGIVHRDEIHRYMDHGEWKESREHLHEFVVPEIKGQLNGKKFSSRAAMRAMNRKIDELSRSRYHVQFLTGEQARKKSVEQLKNASYEEELERTREIVHEAQDEVLAYEGDKYILECEIDDLTGTRDALQEEIERMRREEIELDKQLKKKRKAARSMERDELCR
jgi:hypothetical protein